MKKTIALLFALLLCVALVSPCFAAEFNNPPIYDLAGYLTDSEFDTLSEKLENIRRKYNFDVAIICEPEMVSDDIVSSADDIYDIADYGAGDNDDGILLYICSETREYHFTTHGYGNIAFNRVGIDYLKKNVRPYLTKDEYYLALDTFANLSDELLEMAATGEPLSQFPNDLSYVLIILGIALICPLIIAWLLTSIKAAKMKTAVENNYASNYVKQGTRKIAVSRDIFLYSHIIKTAKPKNDSSSGTHTSSSGRTHGGGGGRF